MNRIDSVIQKMKSDSAYRDYFFKSSSKYQKLHLWLEPLDNEGYFTPKNDRDYSLMVLSYLNAVSIQNKENEKEDVSKKLLSIINNFIQLNIKDEHVEWFLLKTLFNLPIQYITISHIQFIGKSLKQSQHSHLFESEVEKIVIPVLLDNKMKRHLLVLLTIIFDYRLINNGVSFDREPLLTSYWLDELLEKHAESIFDLINMEGLEVIIKIIERVLNKDKSAFNIVWINTIEDSPDNSFPDRYDNQLITFTRDLMLHIESTKIKGTIIDFLKRENPIYKRLAFHVMNVKYKEFSSIFWKEFDNIARVYKSLFRHEFYKLIKDNADSFTKAQLEKVFSWIKGLDYSKYYKDREEEQFKKINAYKKKEWLLTIKDQYPKALQLYNKYHEINPVEIEHPGKDISVGEVKILGKISPIEDVDAFCLWSVHEIIEYISDYDPNKTKKIDVFDDNERFIDGLATDLESCVIKNPNKFIDEINDFHQLDFIYKFYLISGFTKTWKDGTEFDWTNLLDFIIVELTEKFFKSEDKYANRAIGQIANLIEEGTKSDNNAFNKKLLPKAKLILFKLIENRENIKTDENDLAFQSLNTNNGKVLIALLNYSLRYGRLNSNQPVKWEADVKEFFTNELSNNTDYSKLLFFLLGLYLLHLMFLDKQWVKEKFNQIFPIDNDSLWESSISGFFRFTNTVYVDVYKMFFNNNSLIKGLAYDFTSRADIKKKIINHICIMYISDNDDKTLLDILKSKNHENVVYVINGIWHFYKKQKELVETKIFTLWKQIYDNFKHDSSKEASSIFSSLSKWFIFIKSIDSEMMPYLKLTMKYIDKSRDYYHLSESMNRLVTDNSKYIGELFYFMVSNDNFPVYQQQEIINIVESLYLKNESQLALKICNKYKRESIYFLNDLSKKYDRT